MGNCHFKTEFETENVSGNFPIHINQTNFISLDQE